jgi:hypothetical protein
MHCHYMGKKMKAEACSPSKTRRKFSCYLDHEIIQLKEQYNKMFKDKIVVQTPREIWLELVEKIPQCDRESCWSKKLNVKTRRFAPQHPSSWNNNINEWLSSTEITDVMKQYEEAYPEFKYLGPAPSDYNFLENGQCVWPELCKFNVTTLPKTITKVGIVFNLDTHDGPGTHWVGVFIDVPKKVMYYFDSTGEKINKNIRVLYDQIKGQDSKYTLVENAPKEHQMGGSECGVYVLYFIIMMIHKPDFSIFKSDRAFTDKHMEKFRKRLFNDA